MQRLCVILVFTLAACGGGESADSVETLSPAPVPHVADTAPPPPSCAIADIARGTLTACVARDYPTDTANYVAQTRAYFQQYGTGTSYPLIKANWDLLPTQALGMLWTAASMGNDTTMLENGRAHLDYVLSTLQPDGGFVNVVDANGVKYVGSNGQIRIAMGFWIAYRETGDVKYLYAADRTADWVLNAPTITTTSSFTGKTYQLPAYLYTTGRAVASSRSLDPNQEASLALAAQLLYTTPGSKFYNDASIAAKRDEYIRAGHDMLSLNRCVPASDQAGLRDSCDSQYAWSAIAEFHALNVALKNPTLDADLRKQYAYYAPITLAGRSIKAYPTAYDGPIYTALEPLYALDVAQDFDTQANVDILYRQTAGFMPAWAAQSEPAWVATRWLDQLNRFIAR